MPEENDPPPTPTDPPAADQSSLLGGAAPDELFARGMQTVKMTGGAGGWSPPSLEEMGRFFPGYEILGLLGRGGMGAVYQARQIELDRLVAIKLLPLEISVDRDFVDRFRREARAMAKLHHPNIITVFEFGTTAEGHLFIVMEYVEGSNLADIIRQAGLDPEQALSLVEQICTALAYAHHKGIVHRDIKPANVMVTTESQVKVADFGLARLTDPSAEQMGHTMTGTVMGTPDYMAPEQMEGMNVDHRADIYSLGVMLYEMLCRQVPKGIFDPPSHRTGCDPRIDAIVVKAMQQTPDRRYQSTTEMKADVIAARTSAMVVVPSTLPPSGPTQHVEPRPAAGQAPRLPDAAVEAGAATLQSPKAAVMKAIAPPAAAKKSKVPLYVGAAAVLLIGVLAFTLVPKRPLGNTVGSQGSAAPAPTPSGAETEPWQDVLRDPAMLGLSGEVERTPEGLRFTAVGAAMFPLHKSGPRRDGAVRLRATFNEFSPALCARGCPAGIYQLSAHSKKVIRLWRYESAAKQPVVLREFPLSEPLQPGQDYELELRVVGQTLTAKLNGQVLGTATDEVCREGGFGVSVSERSAASALVKSFEVLDLDPPAAPPPTPSAGAVKLDPSNTASLEPGVMRLWDAPEKVPKDRNGLNWKDNALFITDGALVRSPGDSRNLILRFSIRLNDEANNLKVGIRNVGTAKEPRKYQLQIIPKTKTIAFRLEVSEGARTLQTWPLPSPKQGGDWLVIELRAVGADFTVSADGKALGTVHDETIGTAGHFILSAAADGYFRDIVYVPLDQLGAPPSATVQAPSSAPKTTAVRTFAGHRYQFVAEQIPWTEARAKAESLGGHLATLSSRAEYDWAATTFGPALEGLDNFPMFWIGGLAETPGHWRWITDELFVWLGGGAPDSRPEQYPAYLSFQRNGGMLNFNDSAGVGEHWRKYLRGFLVEWDDDGKTPPAAR